MHEFVVIRRGLIRFTNWVDIDPIQPKANLIFGDQRTHMALVLLVNTQFDRIKQISTIVTNSEFIWTRNQDPFSHVRPLQSNLPVETV